MTRFPVSRPIRVLVFALAVAFTLTGVAAAALAPLLVRDQWIEGRALPLTGLFTLATVAMLVRERRQGRLFPDSLAEVERTPERAADVPARV